MAWGTAKVSLAALSDWQSYTYSLDYSTQGGGSGLRDADDVVYDGGAGGTGAVYGCRFGGSCSGNGCSGNMNFFGVGSAGSHEA